MCLSVVVDRGRGSTTTNALEIMKELLGVEESLKILAVAFENRSSRARIGYRDRLGEKKIETETRIYNSKKNSQRKPVVRFEVLSDHASEFVVGGC